ncbi:MAG: enoyl-CoA hydratase/isomerase family protein [Desulfomonile tiedjei]|nr:enoyl-CoA hydratase/isomerase family protein [Desulfomonile tiedjei]
MDLKHTRYEVNRGVATVTLYRPEQMNAFTPDMAGDLLEIFVNADQDDSVRAVVVTGAGQAFCAGADLSHGSSTFDFSENEGKKVSISEHRDRGGKVALAIFNCRKPVIAAINGHAVGIGITMTLPMDIRIVAADAKIGFVFARRGVVPEACSSWFLPRIVGVSRAAEILLTGRIFPAEENAAPGLFNYVLPREAVLPKALEIASEIAERTSAVSVALSKALLWHGLAEKDPQSTHLVDSKCMYWCGREKDAAEGVRSFLDKRPPKFTMSPTNDMPDFYPWWKEPKV